MREALHFLTVAKEEIMDISIQKGNIDFPLFGNRRGGV
jgi:hypothetical protein